MTHDIESDVRGRMRRLELPQAPDALRARVVDVAAARPRGGTIADLGRSGRLLVPIAAMLLIGGAVILGTGSSTPPHQQPTQRPPIGPAIATVQLLAANYESVSHAGGLHFRVKLDGPGGSWSGELTYAELGALTSLDPPLPEKLSAGTYSLRAETWVSGDAIYPGESGPRISGPVAVCTSEFVVLPTTTVVSITLGFWADQRCAAGTITADDPRTLATFLDMPSFGGACGEDVGGCDYRLALSGPGGTWGSVYRTVKPPDQLAINVLTDLPIMLSPGTYRLDASSHRMSREPEPGVGHQSEIEVAGTCFVEFTVGPDMNQVLVSIAFQGETCTAAADIDLIPTAPPPSAVGPIATPTISPEPGISVRPAEEVSFEPPYGDAPPAGRMLDIMTATLNADRTRVWVEFVGSGSYLPDHPCASYAEPWLAIGGDTLVIALVSLRVPSPSACPVTTLVGYLMRYDLALPEPFSGTTIRDLGSGQMFPVGG